MNSIKNVILTRVTKRAAPGMLPALVLPERFSNAMPLSNGAEELADLTAPEEVVERLRAVLRRARLCFDLAGSLTRFLGFGWNWMAKCVRLLMFSAILWPGFLSMIIFYFFSPRVIRNLPYGREPRNQLDLYIPYRKWLASGKKVPVVVFVTGGAWMIGYKAWGALLGRRLSQQGVIVACLDYRNFPQGRACDMVSDVTRGIGWVLKHIHGVGGDRRQVFVVGQSCGGHLALMALIGQATRMHSLAKSAPVATPSGASSPDRDESWHIPCEVVGVPVDPRPLPHAYWDPSQLKGFVSLSSPVDIENLAQHFEQRGLSEHVYRCIMSYAGDESGLADLNPLRHLAEAPRELVARLPPVLCLHGTDDKTVPYQESLKLQDALRGHGVEVACKLYESCTHTWPLIEGPMAGRDLLTADVLQLVKGSGADDYLHSYSLLPFPVITTWLARRVCPF